MLRYPAHDGSSLAYRPTGAGEPLLCLPGGPLRDPVYLGDLGGLAADRRLLRLCLRGSGGSAAPADDAGYRCDRLVDDVESFRQHLGADTLDLLAHSAGANLAALYAARHPRRVRRLILVTPSGRAVGLDADAAQRRAVADLRAGEPWYPRASAALDAIAAGTGGRDDWAAMAPFLHGRWDDAARAHDAAQSTQRDGEVVRHFGAPGAFDPESTSAALRKIAAPVLVVAGEFDVSAPPVRMREYAQLFRRGRLVVQPGAGHYPWQDDAAAFRKAVADFLTDTDTDTPGPRSAPADIAKTAGDHEAS